jgi:adenylate cyclase
MVLAGNTGSRERLSYTLTGNTVNLASRIEQLTKTLNCDTLVSEETVRQLHRSFNLKAESPQNIKGFSKPVFVYRVQEKAKTR